MSASLSLPAKSARSEGSPFALLRRQFTPSVPLPPTLSLASQTAIVTGANAGLGFETARHLLRLGAAHLVMAVRSQPRGDAAAARLRAEFPRAAVSVWLLDLESYDSVRRFAERCAAELERLDMVVLNAGMMGMSFTPASGGSGHEVALQVNYLSTALLAILLLPILKAQRQRQRSSNATAAAAARPPTLSLVTTDLVYSAKLATTAGPILAQLDNRASFSGLDSYGVSKLFLTLFAWKLAEMVDPADVLVNQVNPGMTGGTAFFSTMPYLARAAIKAVQFLLSRRTDVAATIFVDAVAVRGEESHGSLLSEWTIKPLPSMCYTDEGRAVRERLWEETMEELNFAGASKIVKSLKSS